MEDKRIYECIYELYTLIDSITENAMRHDLSLLRVRGGASGCDVYQGAPPICRKRDYLLDKYDDIISKAFKEIERRRTMTNLEKIREMSEQQVIELLLAATRDDLSYFDICSCNCDTCMIQKLCISPKDDVMSMGESGWKEWLESEVKHT